jgi:hypothetical protein
MIAQLKRALGWSADALASTLFRCPKAPQTPEAQRLVADLRRKALALPTLPGGNGQIEAEWLSNLRELRDRLVRHDPWRFTRWPVIRRTMFVANSATVLREWQYLRSRPDWRDRWGPAIQESDVGSPIRFLLSPRTSGSLIHHAAHIARFEQSTGRRTDAMDMVWEFGAGYGGMCRFVHQLGFRGRYLVFDLPEMTALQAYFLRSSGLSLIGAADFAAGKPGILLTSDLEELERLLAPLGGAVLPGSLFIATWSLSEAPLALRARVLDMAAGFGSYLVAYQREFGTVENQTFFERWASSRPDVRWQASPIAHIRGNYYLFGTRGGSVVDGGVPTPSGS